MSHFNSLGYSHPGAESFIELGIVKNRSVLGYEVIVPYGVPKFVFGPVTLEAFRLNVDILEFGAIKIGPMVNYNFMGYSGKETGILAGMKRSGFLETGLLATISVPMGMVFAHASKANHDEPGNIFKVSYATGIPLYPMNGNHLWLNLMGEYTYYSRETASYIYGVKEREQTSTRSQHTIDGVSAFSTILGLWTPMSKKWWINLTYKVDNYDNKILKSPIVSRDSEETFMLGLLYSFGKLL